MAQNATHDIPSHGSVSSHCGNVSAGFPGSAAISASRRSIARNSIRSNKTVMIKVTGIARLLSIREQLGYRQGDYFSLIIFAEILFPQPPDLFFDFALGFG